MSAFPPGAYAPAVPAVPGLAAGAPSPANGAIRELSERLNQGAAKVLVGQEETFRFLTVAMLVGGHTLLEGVPGTAKTLMAKTLATLVGGTFRRVQFTPDLMPSDITGTTVFDIQSSQFTLRRGPVFTDVLLGDEINRAPAKTQSALLEAMEERQVTIDGEPHALSPLFTVIATQNPIEFEGTYPLPEAQLDRFLFKLIVTYTPHEAETELLRRVNAGFDAHALERAGLAAVTEPAHILACRRLVQAVRVDEAIIGYIEAIVWTTRQAPDLLLGASPRAAIALLQGAKALAALDGRAYVVPDDIKALAAPVLRHRLIVRPEAELSGITGEVVIGRVLSSVPVPR
ncbi:MAG: MoxR family ATPase [Chloroflexota bacterium]|nr:MoxR family ATPase [Chloroflexota bacterium]